MKGSQLNIYTMVYSRIQFKNAKGQLHILTEVYSGTHFKHKVRVASSFLYSGILINAIYKHNIRETTPYLHS